MEELCLLFNPFQSNVAQNVLLGVKRENIRLMGLWNSLTSAHVVLF